MFSLTKIKWKNVEKNEVIYNVKLRVYSKDTFVKTNKIYFIYSCKQKRQKGLDTP